MSTRFNLTVLRPNGSGVANAQVRLLNGAGTDITASYWGSAEVYTNDNGVFDKLSVPNDIPADSTPFTLQVIARKFETWSFATVGFALMIGTYTANLVPTASATNYTLSEPVDAPLSSMLPIVCAVTSPNADFDWELITATVTHPGGSKSIIESPIEKTTSKASIDIRNRVQLGVRPLLVSDNDLTRQDTEFSTVVEVTFGSITDEGDTTINGTFKRFVAHTLPPKGKTDLSGYINQQNQAWIVPAQPVYVFRGYYRDVMFWLWDTEEGEYTLSTDYYDSAGQKVKSETATLLDSEYVQRLRIDTDQPDHVTKIIFRLMAGTQSISQPLTVLFRD